MYRHYFRPYKGITYFNVTYSVFLSPCLSQLGYPFDFNQHQSFTARPFTFGSFDLTFFRTSAIWLRNAPRCPLLITLKANKVKYIRSRHTNVYLEMKYLKAIHIGKLPSIK